jgi:hypothetical protein
MSFANIKPTLDWSEVSKDAKRRVLSTESRAKRMKSDDPEVARNARGTIPGLSGSRIKQSLSRSNSKVNPEGGDE